MCTVSFVPVNGKIIITSNRDEKMIRPAATPPTAKQTEMGTLYYPTDAKAGGTWFIANDRGDVGVLLNGAYTCHQPKPYYKASRGSILPTIFNNESIIDHLHSFNFNEIENCTLVLFIENKLYECIWDGDQLIVKELDANQSHIWSSVTLYTPKMIDERSAWFKQFMCENYTPTQNQLVHFHTNTGKGNEEYGLKMNRNNTMLTVSITSIEIKNKAEALLYYCNLINGQEVTSTINLLPIIQL